MLCIDTTLYQTITLGSIDLLAIVDLLVWPLPKALMSVQ